MTGYGNAPNSFEILDSVLDSSNDVLNEDEIADPIVTDWPEHKPDPRLIRLSYSSSLLLQSCPRKYQLQKMNLRTQLPPSEYLQKLTFGFGHMVGEGVQSILEGKSHNDIMFPLFLKWDSHLFEENEKQKKSFFHGVLALNKLISMMEDGFLAEYEMVYYDAKPATELSLKILFPDNFTHRGFVDIVLRNKDTGKYCVFEVKTNSAYAMNHFQYKNSSQATGYSVLLDKIEPGHSDYTVYYLVYMTKLERWECFEFPKSHSTRALWIRDRMYDNEAILNYVEREGNYGMWPFHGQSCWSFGRECEYMNTCHMETSALVQPLRESQLVEKAEYQFEFKVEDLI